MVSGKAIFECRNREEATWFALLVNKYFSKRNVFPEEMNVYDLIGNSISLEVERQGIYAVLTEKSRKVYLTIYADYSIDGKDRYLLYFPLFFLSKQTKLIDCNFFIRSDNQEHLYFFVKYEGKIIYKIYKSDCYTDCEETRYFNLFDLINSFPTFYKPISCIVQKTPINFNFNEKVLIKSDNGEKSYKLSLIFEKIFSLLFSNLISYFYAMNERFNYKSWKKEIEKIKINQIDIQKLLLNKINFDDFCEKPESDLLKLQAIFCRIIDALIDYKDIHGKYFSFEMQPTDNFLSEKGIRCEFEFEFDSDSFSHQLNYYECLFDSSLEDYYKETLKQIFPYGLYSDDSFSSFINLFISSKDFYNEFKKFPKVYLKENIYIPLEPHFISLFFDEFEGKKLDKKSNDTYSLIKKQNSSICESCIHKIRKLTLGCKDCLDFHLLSK